MRKRLFHITGCVLAALSCFLFFARGTAADAAAVGTDAAEEADGLYESTGAADLFARLDDETRALLEAVGADLADPGSAARVSPAGVLNGVAALFSDGLGDEVKQLSLLLSMLLLFAAVSCFLPRAEEDGTLSLIVFLCFAAVEIPTATALVGGVLSSLEAVSAFVRLLVPLMGVLVSASGAPAASAALTATAVGAAEAVSLAVDSLFVPLTGAYGAVCVIGAADGFFSADRGMRLVKKVFSVLVGGAALVFTGVLSLRGAASKAADSLALRGAKFLVGGLVPVVGGAMSEGLSAVTASLNAVNDSVGALGIAAIAMILLPPIVRVLTHRAVLWCASLAGELAGIPRAGAYFSGISEALSMLDILLLLDGLVFICALGLLIGAG